jgi:hypothetical protein
MGLGGRGGAMLERIDGLPEGVEGWRGLGTVSKHDLQREVAPTVSAAQRDKRRLRVLYELGRGFRGFTPGGAWQDTKLGIIATPVLEGAAVVTDLPVVRDVSRYFGFLMPYPLRVFRSSQREEAVAWLASLPEDAAVTHRLLTDPGVVVVSVDRPLRVQDFGSVTEAVDAVIASKGELAGLVIHTRRFPGWQNLRGLLGHARFLRTHLGKIRRVAIASDSRIASLAPRIERVLRGTEVRGFSYGALESAIVWASGSTETSREVGAARPPEPHPDWYGARSG